MEKNLSCGEISDFCKEFEQFMEFHQNLCRFCSKFVWRKNDKYEVWLKQINSLPRHDDSDDNDDESNSANDEEPGRTSYLSFFLHTNLEQKRHKFR